MPIGDSIDGRRDNPKPLIRTASAGEIPEKSHRARTALMHARN